MEKLQNELVKVEIKLPENCCWWESPRVCRWEPWEESKEFKNLSPELQHYNLHYEDYVESEKEKLFTRPKLRQKGFKEVVIDDVDLSETQEISSLVKYLMPEIPLSYKFYLELKEEYEDMKAQWKKIKMLQQENAGETFVQPFGKTTSSHEIFMESRRNSDYSEVTFDGNNVHRELNLDLIKFKNRYNLEAPHELFPRKEGYGFNLNVRKLDQEKLSTFNKKLLCSKPSMSKLVSKSELDEDEPTKNEPILLSQFLIKMQKFQEKEQVAFKELDEVDDTKTKFLDEAFERKTFLKDNDKGLKLIPHSKGKWKTKFIHDQTFDSKTNIFTFYTGKLGENIFDNIFKLSNSIKNIYRIFWLCYQEIL